MLLFFSLSDQKVFWVGKMLGADGNTSRVFVCTISSEILFVIR